MDKLYFETNGEELLVRAGMSKAVFAEKMNVKRQNVNALFQTKNIHILRKAATVLNVPFEMLTSYPSEPDIHVNGYVEVNGEIHRITGKQDVQDLLKSLDNHQ